MILLVDFSLNQGFGYREKRKETYHSKGLFLWIISFVIAFEHTKIKGE